MYLDIGTWSEPEITAHWIAGPLIAWESLAQLIEHTIPELALGGLAPLREAFSPRSPYDLVLELRGELFDPAREDKQCW